jgi:hypothetical protein
MATPMALAISAEFHNGAPPPIFLGVGSMLMHLRPAATDL